MREIKEMVLMRRQDECGAEIEKEQRAFFAYIRKVLGVSCGF